MAGRGGDNDMAETTSHLPEGSAAASPGRSATGAFIILLLAFAPQIVELLISLAGLVVPLSGRSPAQVLSGHGSALIFALPSLVEQYAAGGKASLSSDVLLALIYTYPL